MCSMSVGDINWLEPARATLHLLFTSIGPVILDTSNQIAALMSYYSVSNNNLLLWRWYLHSKRGCSWPSSGNQIIWFEGCGLAYMDLYSGMACSRNLAEGGQGYWCQCCWSVNTFWALNCVLFNVNCYVTVLIWAICWSLQTTSEWWTCLGIQSLK